MYEALARPHLAAACGLLLVAAATPAAAQIDTTDWPQPPRTELAALHPFFGTYEHSDSYWMGAGPYQGTFEVGPAIKGWYVEWVIDTHYGPDDRELRILTTWDAELGRYRIWRFETGGQLPPGTMEGEARFEGDQFVMEWTRLRGPAGERGTFRNRIWLEGPDVLVTHTEVEPEEGGLLTLGVWRHRRVGAGARD